MIVYPKTIEEKINRIPLFLTPLKRNTTAVNIFFSVGSFKEEKNKAGISHLIEHLLFEGSKKYPSQEKLGQAIEKFGGRLNGFTSFRQTGFWIYVPASALDKTLEVIFDLVFNPIALENEKIIAKEKKIILEEIKRNKDNPDSFIYELAAENFHPHHPINQPIAGYEKTVKNFDTNLIKYWWQNNFITNNMAISIAGQIPDNIKTKIESFIPNRKFCLKTIFTFPKYKPYNKIRISINNKKIDQIKLALSFEINQKLDLKKSLMLSILSDALGYGLSSILFQKIRTDLGLCYDIHSETYEFPDFEILNIMTGLAPENFEKALTEIINILKNIKEKGLPKEKFQDIKDFRLGDLEISSDSTIFLADAPLDELSLYGRALNFKEIIETLKSITKKEVDKFAQSFICPNNVALTTLGPTLYSKEKIKKIIKQLN